MSLVGSPEAGSRVDPAALGGGLPLPTDDRHLGGFDLLVVGASLQGISAALGAAAAGCRVLIVENSISPAPEIFEALALDVPLRVQVEWVTALELGVAVDPCGLHPARWKCALEDRLLEAGVELLYSLTPFAWQSGADGWKMALVGKSGRWWAEGKAVVEATPHPVFAAQFGRPPLARTSCSRRRIEFTEVDVQALETAGQVKGTADDPDWSWEKGPAGATHVFVDVLLASRGQLAEGYRHAGVVAERLRKNHPAFRHARLASIARLDLPENPADEASGRPVETDRAGYWYLGCRGRVSGDALKRVQSVNFQTLLRYPGCSGSGHLAVISKAVDVLVVGGGTCGASAAMAAAGNGACTLVAERHAGLGGTGTTGGINSYWFGYRSGHNVRLTQRLRGLERDSHGEPVPHWKMRTWNVEEKKALLGELAAEAGVEIAADTQFVAALRNGQKVTGAWLLKDDRLLKVDAFVTVDATGDGDVAADAGVPFTYGTPRTGSTMWFTLTWLESPGRYRSNFTSSLDVGDARDFTRAVQSGRRRGVDAWDHAPMLSTRESRHITTDVQLTLTDQLLRREWPDTVAIAFSNHDVKGYTESPWLRIGLVPPNLRIEIPFRALIPKGWEGLLVTGKAMGATADGLPAIRMQADFENLGYATGLAAASAVSSRCPLRAVSVRDLQRLLTQEGNLPGNILERTHESSCPKVGQLRQFVAALDDRVSLQRFQDMKMGEVWDGPIPFVEIVAAGDLARALLVGELCNDRSPRRRMAARALAILGSPEAATVLLEEAWEHLGGSGLPSRSQPLHYAQAPPDQANMPELAYLLHALAMTRSPLALPIVDEVVKRMDATDEALRSSTSGLFDYVDAVCHIAESVGSPHALPALRGLQSHALWSRKCFRGAFQADWFEERKAFLELRIHTALAACGDSSASRVVEEYLNDSRRPIERHARLVMERLAAPSGASADPTPNAYGDFDGRCLVQYSRPSAATRKSASGSSSSVTPQTSQR